MNWGYLGDWLDAVRLPVLCLGVGAQASEERRIELPAEGRRVWHAIADRAPSVGVRGSFSASVLADNGVKNVDIVGCPTIFRSLAPALYLRHKSIDEIDKVAFSLRRETGDNYTNNVDEFLEIQKKLIVRLNRRFSLVVTAHGEIEEKIYYYNDIARLKEARRKLIDSNWFDPILGRDLENIYATQLFFTPVVSHYDELTLSLDFTIGYRVHGILPALAMGTPGVLLRYDARSAELAETLRVPIFDPKAALTASFESIFHRNLFCEFEANYPAAYQTMRAFLEKHRIANSMQEVISAAA
jgi:polysaccharide pyruvyl transferase WcaK-like protein